MAAVAATETPPPRSSGESRRRPRISVVPPPRMGRGTGTGIATPLPLARPATLAAAGLATASVPLHGWMLVGHSHGVVLTVLMGAMALWCQWCAVSAVRGTACARVRAVQHLWVMAAAMAVLHVALLTGSRGGAHQHGSDPVSTAAGTGADAGAGLMLAIIVLEVAVCFACALALRTRHRVVRIVPPQHAQGDNCSQPRERRPLTDPVDR